MTAPNAADETMHGAIETEFKLRAAGHVEVAAIDAAVREAGFVAHDASAARHVDVYLDDRTGSLRRAGVGLRLREIGSERRLCGKSHGTRNGGLFVRDEWEAVWPHADGPRTAADLPPKLRDVVEPFLLDRPLREVLRLSTQRDRRLVGHGARDLAELAIDRVEATAAGRAASFLEVEIEVLDDLPTCEQLADRLARGLPLRAATDDKPNHAGTLLGLQRAASPAQPDPQMPVALAFAAVAHEQLAALQRAEAGVRGDDAAEHVHALRVAARRLRELVRSFGDLWPKARRVHFVELLRETGGRFGPVRDLDVLTARLPDVIARAPDELQDQGPPLLAWLAERRAQAMAAARQWLRDPGRIAEQRQLVEELERIGDAARAGGDGRAIADDLPDRIAKAARRVRKRARKLPAELPLAPLHELRIACKRLRYLGEAFASLHGEEFGKALATLKRAQERLGKVCDRDTAARRLLAWVAEGPATGGDARRTAALLGALAATFARGARRARRQVEDKVARLADGHPRALLQ